MGKKRAVRTRWCRGDMGAAEGIGLEDIGMVQKTLKGVRRIGFFQREEPIFTRSAGVWTSLVERKRSPIGSL